MRMGESSRWGSPSVLFGGQLLKARNVLAQDVKLEVDLRADVDVAEIGVREGVGNDADGEEIPFEVIAWRKLPTPYQPKGE